MTLVGSSARLQLRRYRDTDLAWLTTLLGDARTMQHWPAPLTAQQSRAWLQRAAAAYEEPGYGRFCVELSDGTPIGDAGVLRAEINGRAENDLGYIIEHRFWRHGYGLEAARLCVELAQHSGMERIVANMAVDNIGSVRIAERLGFARRAIFVNARNRGKETLLFVWSAAQQIR